MKHALTATLMSLLLATGCTTATDRQIAGGLIGGAIGGLTADAIGSSDEWVILATLAGAAAGTLVARNSETGMCAYARGNGTYYRAPCR